MLHLKASSYFILLSAGAFVSPKVTVNLFSFDILNRDHLSAISAISPHGDLYLLVQEKAFDSAAVIDFLRALLAEIPGQMLIVWDGATIHRSQAIKQFLSDGAAKRILLERLPPMHPNSIRTSRCGTI